MSPPRLAGLCLILLASTLVPPQASAVAAGTGVVISEFRFRGPAGLNDDFVEIYNPGETFVDVSNWKLQGCSATGGTATTRATLPAGTLVGPRRHLLFVGSAYSGATPGDAVFLYSIADAGGARIVDAAGLPVDAVGASSSHAQCREGAGMGVLSTDHSAAAYRRLGGQQDSNENVVDFEGPFVGSPQGLSSPTTPDAPFGTSASPGAASGTVLVQWGAPSSDGGSPVLHYRVHRGLLPGAETLVGTTAELTFADSGLEPGATYYYVVTAVNAEGEGPQGDTATTIAGVGTPSTIPAPEAGPLVLLGAGLALVALARRARA